MWKKGMFGIKIQILYSLSQSEQKKTTIWYREFNWLKSLNA